MTIFLCILVGGEFVVILLLAWTIATLSKRYEAACNSGGRLLLQSQELYAQLMQARKGVVAEVKKEVVQ